LLLTANGAEWSGADLGSINVVHLRWNLGIKRSDATYGLFRYTPASVL